MLKRSLLLDLETENCALRQQLQYQNQLLSRYELQLFNLKQKNKELELVLAKERKELQVAFEVALQLLLNDINHKITKEFFVKDVHEQIEYIAWNFAVTVTIAKKALDLFLTVRRGD